MPEVSRAIILVEILLPYQNALAFDINEQKGDDNFSAIHHAAKKVAIHGGRSLYDLLKKYGGREDLADVAGLTAAEHLERSLAERQIAAPTAR